MKPVKITINSFSGQLTNPDKITVVAYGKMAKRVDKYYAVYEETSLTGMEGTKTTIKWDEHSVTILRTGTYNNRQEYIVGYPCESVYTTPYLTIPIKSTTNVVEIKKNRKMWNLHVEYELEVGQEANGSVILDIEIEEDVSSEH
ncbi:hypothetical protein SDC9_40079 [bioreactor metagenome]|jgi:Uncharacterized protein conserved in bacteria|uniref:DUF1934 domain-containing protein n=1 Tax=bioreactor metagenome TaxID=1076179 RepID=A0A644VRC5_9ZZZZ|nr:DUF1934 domain-containing protein [Acidaminococcaceae bacterium]